MKAVKPNAVQDSVSPDSPAVAAVRAQLEDRLLTNPAGIVVFAKPRIMPRSQVAALDVPDADGVTVEDIATSEESFLIESRPEYGGSTLCRLIQLEILQSGKAVSFRNARDLPNYKRKLEAEFSEEVGKSGVRPTLIIDDVDLERDERLISELYESNLFARAIFVSVNRRLTDSIIADLEALPFKPKVTFLWALGREEIRSFAATVLEANDAISESKAVDKVYSDLLGLRIPLTPSNVLMYLRVLQREGDFEPLSRVDILSRYLSESLRKPSDVTADSFNAKNKMDVLSSFSFHLHKNKVGEFDEREWLNFTAAYQARTLNDFDSRTFLNELLESRVFGFYSGGYFFRYSFYFTFFLGRYLWPRPAEIRNYFESGDYLSESSVVDVVTGLGPKLNQRVEAETLS